LAPRASRTDDITCVLRDEVLTGRYRPGERLPSERDLAARFRTTRAVARVALKKLEQLGIADVRPGGARVLPLCEASLDVVGHLLALQNPPDPHLVDQVLEVLGALMATTARLAVERGDDAHLDRARDLIDRIHAPELPEAERMRLVPELAHLFMEASDNVVLQIVRRSLRTTFFERLHDAVGSARPDPATFEPMAKDLAAAIDRRDAAGASESVTALWSGLRASIRSGLEASR
jgi:GntR family transcriptional repressor for pyruvate dehydrogenase complex